MSKRTAAGNRSPEDGVLAVEAALAKSRRYTAVAPATVRRMAQKALRSSQGDVNDAVKRTKRALHEIYGAYLPGTAPNYSSMLRTIRAAAETGDPEDLRNALASAMRVHASTRERLPYLAEFYRGVLDRVPEFTTVRDLACGLNPLATPWMGLPESATYLASDIDVRQMEFLDQVLDLLDHPHRVEVLDLLDGPVDAQADVTLLLKAVPPLERQQAGRGWAMLEAINSPIIVVTFPTKSLGSRSKGMFQNYSAAVEEHVAGRNWQVEQFEIPNELVYIVTK